MDIVLWLIIVFPLLFVIGEKLLFSKQITWTEVAAQVILCVGVVLLVWSTGRYSAADDVELLNDSISSKNVVRQACPWGWVDYQDSFCSNYSTRSVRDGETCTTYTDSKGKSKRSCTPRYKTQYNYDYPWEQRWYVSSSGLNSKWQIRRVDGQGAVEPPKYTSASVGDPASITHSYENWIKAASDSIFYQDGQVEEKYAGVMPKYPSDIYDDYKVDRVIGVGVTVPPQYNVDLGKILEDLGPQRQMNAVVVLVDATKVSDDFPAAVRRAWAGFKKNDAVIFIGLDAQQNVQWTNVMSWSKENLFNVTLRENINDQRGKPLDEALLMRNIHDVGMASYVRRPMADFEYLKDQIPVPLWLIIVCSIISIGGSIGLWQFFMRYDLNELLTDLFSSLTSNRRF